MPVHILPLSASIAYNRRVVDFFAHNHAVTAVHLSHVLCHHADELLDNPEHAGVNRAVAGLYRQRGFDVWAWTHEVHHPPQRLLDEHGRLRFDDGGLRDWLQRKYSTFFEDTLPGLTGLVLTFAETEFTVYQNERVISAREPDERTAELICIMRDICHTHGVRLVVRDFVYRRSEVDQMRRTLETMPSDVGIMSKVVPHDWHPYYPLNPLLGAFDGREQWVEHDFGHEYEGQHLYPFADLPVLRDRVRASVEAGCTTMCLRLDRYSGDVGQSAVDTPWGRRECAAAVAHLTDEGLPSMPDEEEELLSLTATVVKRTLFPARMWLADHSNIPTYRYAVSHLVDGNADRLPVWTEDPADREVEAGFRSMDAFLETRLEREMEEARGALVRCRRLASRTSLLSPYAAAVESLDVWFAVWSAYRDAFFLLRRVEERGIGTLHDVEDSIAHFAETAGSVSKMLGNQYLEGRPATEGHRRKTRGAFPFEQVVASLRERCP